MRAHAEDDQLALGQAVAEAGTVVSIDGSSQTRQSSQEEHESSMAETAAPLAEMRPCTPTESTLGRFSPRLNYSLPWPETVKILTPPVDIRQCVGDGRHTVAGCIMWTCLDYALAVTKDAAIKHTLAGPQDLPPQSPAQKFFDVALSHSKPLHDIAYMLELVEARIELRDTGYMRSDSRGANEVSRRILEGSVQDDLRERGVKMEQWWTVSDIEAYIWDLLDASRSFGLQRSLKTSTAVVMPLAKSLAPRSVCFGDGPRWNAKNVAILARTWVQTVNEIFT